MDPWYIAVDVRSLGLPGPQLLGIDCHAIQQVTCRAREPTPDARTDSETERVYQDARRPAQLRA